MLNNQTNATLESGIKFMYLFYFTIPYAMPHCNKQLNLKTFDHDSSPSTFTAKSKKPVKYRANFMNKCYAPISLLLV